MQQLLSLEQNKDKGFSFIDFLKLFKKDFTDNIKRWKFFFCGFVKFYSFGNLYASPDFDRFHFIKVDESYKNYSEYMTKYKGD